ncbi:DUF1427 family protein [Tatumella sp. UBA2305]|uniref:DUF1427 family protein n=1 Tax=Tatumella sp. UBA2305 TaxID=1947647 RepID=UPI0025D2A68E|nr:DUF1427 family protein [Tatumella sp. UBA2305]
MSPLLLSLGVGVLTGLIYSLLKVQSPAPPAVALVGLLGMVMGSTAGGELFHTEVSARVPTDVQSQTVSDKPLSSPPRIGQQAG